MTVSRSALRFLPAGWAGVLGIFLLMIGPFAAPEVWAQEQEEPSPPTPADSVWWNPEDPRLDLAAGWLDAEAAGDNMELLASDPRPDVFVDPDRPGDLNFANTDIAFRGDHAIVGNFYGFMVYDISTPERPELDVAVVCPGGQGDVSIYDDLVFMSVEQTRGRLDCDVTGAEGEVNADRFRGVRIFDVSDLTTPQQVAAVQTCRGSHTHTILDDPKDDENLYVYVSGTSSVRPEEEMEGCVADPDDPETSLYQIEVIQVPLDAPEDAEIVNEPRLFADEETDDVAGLWPGGTHGEGTQRSRETNQCHDITTYPAIGLAAGACSGNGLLLDISDPTEPERVDEVADKNFAYWHSAMFSNDGSTVVYTDEWGGGTMPRCRKDDPTEWGANAFFTRDDGEMEQKDYYKLPVPQKATENCVAHNGSLVPVPGRDIKVQAWYQGGVSVLDFTDPDDPYEIAYFDRGPMSDDELQVAGYWSTYWYNGHIYGTEIARGFDVFELTPSEHLTENELAAAELVTLDQFNPQHQPRIEWPADPVVARAYLDQLERREGLSADRIESARNTLDRLDAVDEARQRELLSRLAEELEEARNEAADPEHVGKLVTAVETLAAETG